MPALKCKMCGGDLNITEGASVCECEYCGTKQTVPSADDEKKLNLFARANRLRFGCEFDKAAGVYETIVAEFPQEAEAYWGLVLCKYGIEYVNDPRTGKKVPTCHRSSFRSVTEDDNCRLALEYADVAARDLYRNEAEQIEALRHSIIAVSSQEEPYDIFICYKETDAVGGRTLDSVIAQDVYTALTNQGYRVFFSRISLEDKLGAEYEPYIFAALHSAKVMLAFGTRPDYYNAVWVKNEWSRYLQLMAKGEPKTLIPCYKNMSAYDMPDEFARLQAQDMGKVGAMQDLLRGIEKILPRGTAPSPVMPDYPTAATVTTGGTTQLMLEGDTMYEGETFANIPHGHGKAIYKDGCVYEGLWNRGKRHGQGTIVWASGDKWIGEFRDDKVWKGNGIWLYEDGRYDGAIDNGDRHGQGTFTNKNGNVYEGAWVRDKRHGQGKLSWNNHTAWEGEFYEDKIRNGNGVWYYSTGHYEGPFANGVGHGNGKFVWKDGGEWIGEFHNGKPWNGYGIWRKELGYYDCPVVNGVFQGNGRFVWKNGNRYEGQIVNSRRHGQGKMSWAGGGEWHGEFRDDQCWNGYGMVFFGENRYVGPLVNGLCHGQGRYMWKAGGEWVGEFCNNNRWNGYGVWRADDGFFEGQIVNGAAQGPGRYVWKQGGEWRGEFHQGNFWNGSGMMLMQDGSYRNVVTKMGKHW